MCVYRSFCKFLVKVFIVKFFPFSKQNTRFSLFQKPFSMVRFFRIVRLDMGQKLLLP